MKRRIIFAVCLLCYFSVVFAAQAQVVVYVNQNSDRPGLISDNPVGDEVTLAGENRIITGIVFDIAQVDNGEGRASFQLILYNNDGAEGEPNTVLWESAWKEDYFMEGSEDHIFFPVPNIVVPDTFTWTLNITESRPQSTCLLFGDEPTVGSCESYHWNHDLETDTWSKTYPAGEFSVNFACQITALKRGSIVPLGDFDESHIIDLKDFMVLSDHWLETNIYDSNDIVPDHTVNLLDLHVMMQYWLYDFRCLPCKQSCGSHLHKIGIGLYTYANDYNGHYPTSLQELIDYYTFPGEEISNYMFCPCSTDPIGAISYAYRGSGLRNSVSASTILAYDKTGNHVDCPEFRNVLFGYGWISQMNEDDFVNAIAADNEWRVGRGWPELPIE